MLLETSYAETIIRSVENDLKVGRIYVVVEQLPADICLQPHQLNSFSTIDQAMDDLNAKIGLPGSAGRRSGTSNLLPARR